MSLLVVGTVAFDNIETPFGRADKVVGGAATYIALSASYYTQHLKIVSVIGDDFPEEDLNDLRRRGVAGHDLVHRGVGFVGAEAVAGEKTFHCVVDGCGGHGFPLG